MKDAENGGNCHAGHRKRLKKRFLDEGLENFQDHNILELLLFYGIPRKDTNELAHTLLRRFGSLSGVFDADFDILTSVNGVSENTAVLLKLIPRLARAYLLDHHTRTTQFGSIGKLGHYLVNYYVGEQKEKLTALYFNSRMELLDMVTISVGTVISTEIPVRRIAEVGFAKNAAYLILAHNHPDGNPYPSQEDILLTEQVGELFSNLGMPLLEHFVIGDGGYRTICSGAIPEF